MLAHQSRISGVVLLEPKVIDDDRGFFLENHKDSVLSSAIGRPHRFAQANHSRSQANTLRGFRKEPWDKLIYVVHGTAVCAVVDTRPDSPTFGSFETFTLGDAPGRRWRLFVPTGVSNAFYCLTEVDYFNDVSGEYAPHERFGFIWNDPDVGVDWPCERPILSETDQRQPRLRSLFPDHPFFRKPAASASVA